MSAHLPQSPAALHDSDPEQGEHIGGFQRRIGAASASIPMQALLSTDAPTAPVPRSADAPPNPVLGSRELQRLGERLRLTYGPVEAPLPARLAELVERLALREQGRD